MGSTPLTTAAVGAAGTILGVLITVVVNNRMRRSELAAARRTELVVAMREYLAALDALTLELAEVPAAPRPTWLDRGIDRAVDRFGLQLAVYLIIRLIERAAYGNRRRQLSDRLVAAAAHLRLIAPPPIQDVMQEIEAAMISSGTPPVQWRSRWEQLRPGVRAAFHHELGV